MAELHISLVDFLDTRLDKDNKLKRGSTKGEWLSGNLIKSFFSQLAKQGSPIHKKKAGMAFGGQLLEETKRRYDFETIQEAVSFIPKVYTHIIKGEGAGIWKTAEVRDGFVCIQENTPFDCFFTEGMLSGFLVAVGASGAMVRHTECRKDEEDRKFCTYELVWMKSNLKGS